MPHPSTPHDTPPTATYDVIGDGICPTARIYHVLEETPSAGCVAEGAGHESDTEEEQRHHYDAPDKNKATPTLRDIDYSALHHK